LEHERAKQIVNKVSSNSKYNKSNRNSSPKVTDEKKVYSVETKKRILPTNLSREERLLKRRLNKEKKIVVIKKKEVQ
jgi:hypothetical protein